MGRPVGRPRSLPPGARCRNILLTDEEYDAVKALVKRLRKRSKVKPS